MVEWREGDGAQAQKAAYLGERDGVIRSRLQALAGQGLGKKGPLGFADEMRVVLHGMVRRVRGRRGVKMSQLRQMVYE